MKSQIYMAVFRIGIWLATKGGEKVMPESLRIMLAANAVYLIMAGRLSIENVSPAFRDLVDEMLAAPEPK